ncbi:MAG TPA: type VI secretion system baseplate subunit TssF, partial [Longimicrobiales bacterium]|nr:type VI secretion system baseplate subunit TssF [Longimicrobiales bacterium]
RLECPEGVKLHELALARLRLHVSAEASVAYTVYELLCNNVQSILLRGIGADGSQGEVHASCELHPVGFEDEEGLLPYPRQAFLPYRTLQEYFVFPEKYLFLDLSGLEALGGTEWERGVEVVVLVSPFERADRAEVLESGVSARTFRLGCTPIVNLFQRSSEPILLSHKRQEYPIVADARRRDSTRIYSVDDVSPVGSAKARSIRFQPLYSLRHGFGDERRVLWYARRRHLPWAEQGTTDVAVSFVDRDARMVLPDLDAVSARLTCFNGDLPSQLPFGTVEGDFEMPGGGPVARVSALVKPTATIEPPLGKSLLWRLISQLSLNYVSLVEGGPEALQ